MKNVAASSRRTALDALAGHDARLSGIAEQLVSLVAPTSIAADQYRALRHTIERLRKDSGYQAIAVTSPSPGDGKTVTTLNLAGALAQAQDSRVLVVDADLRKPSVANYLALDGLRSPGLSDALRDSRFELHQLVRHLKGFNLWVVPAGPPEMTPYELLSSPRFDELMREARRDFDCVLVDTPPSLLMPDTRLIERWVDGIVLVVAAHKTPRKLVAEALNVLDPAKMLGVIFNADDQPTSSYYGYYGYEKK
jgi:capsular exopolysaccharide synthesis family protein